MLHNNCNMGMKDLPDTYAQNPRANGTYQAIMSVHVISNSYTYRLWNSENQLTALPVKFNNG